MSTTEARVAVVTGAARGIGRRIAEVLAGRGYSLALVDRDCLDESLVGVEAAGADAVPVIADVSREEEVAAAAATVLDRFGRTDVLVNNAGISLIGAAEGTSPAGWRRVLEVNLTGPFLLSRAFYPVMLRQRSGSVVNIASIAGLRGIPDRVAYNASKHGLVGLTRSLAVEWGSRGIRVNAVCPSWVKTGMDVEDQAAGAYTDEDIVGRVPLARFATPDDVAQAVAFLADDTSSGYVNGLALSVDGGWHTDAGWLALRLSKR